MNVKTAQDVLNLSPMWIATKARRLGIRKIKGQYDLTDQDIERIRNAPKQPYRRVNKRARISRETGISGPQVSAVAYRLRITIRNDYDALLYVCKKYKTGFYTYKGLRKLLKDFKARI